MKPPACSDIYILDMAKTSKKFQANVLPLSLVAKLATRVNQMTLSIENPRRLDPNGTSA